MPTVNVQHCLRDFSHDVQETVRIVNDAKTFKIQLPSGSYHSIGLHKTSLFAGLALIRLYLAWEDFLENVFVRYMCGARSNTGYAPVLISGVSERSILLALHKLLNPSPGTVHNYLNWSSSYTQRRANIHFIRGEPFSTAIAANSQPLQDIETVRNAVAHRSSYATQQFYAVVRREFGYVPPAHWPGRFLLRIHPIYAPLTYLEYYADILLNMGRMIVP